MRGITLLGGNIMKIELKYDTCYVEKLSMLMKAIRNEEASDFCKESLKDSLYEHTVVYFIPSNSEWIVGTERSYISIRNEMIGCGFSETFDVSECDLELVDIFYSRELSLFEGTFIDACRFILDVALRKWREFGVHIQ